MITGIESGYWDSGVERRRTWEWEAWRGKRTPAKGGREGKTGQTVFLAFIFGKFASVGEWRRPF